MKSSRRQNLLSSINAFSFALKPWSKMQFATAPALAVRLKPRLKRWKPLPVSNVPKYAPKSLLTPISRRWWDFNPRATNLVPPSFAVGILPMHLGESPYKCAQVTPTFLFLILSHVTFQGGGVHSLWPVGCRSQGKAVLRSCDPHRW